MLFQQISSDIIQAMKQKDELKLSVLRMVKSKILNVNARGDLEDAEIIKIISKYAKSLEEAIAETRKVNRLDEVLVLESELAIVKTYLPKQLSEEEIKKAVADTIQKLGAASIKDMGKVMKEIGANYPGIDNSLVSKIVKEKLSA